MTNKLLRSLLLSFILASTMMAWAQIAWAGPPLVCWPFDIGNAKSLPWGGSGWHATNSDYDIHRLVDDTLALLSADAPVLVRMETLRRATVYAMKDSLIGNQLYSRLAARAQDVHQKGNSEALALFDAGYLAESLKQANVFSTDQKFASNPGGYSSVLKAIALRGNDPEMEFAAALISIEPRRSDHPEHLQKAVAGASENSQLARNLVGHFGGQGKTFAELRSNVLSAKK
ncbi:MAG: hypothetical protein LAO31_15010 [Acidobacteriia bacterium]|nr:hypothetical protein [Terriglobia bacterium]